MHECYEKMKKIVEGIESPDERAKIINEFLDENPHCNNEYTLQEIGELLGVSRERVRQIEKRVISMLKHPNIQKKLKDIVEEFMG